MVHDQAPTPAVQPIRAVHDSRHAVRIHERHPAKVQPDVATATEQLRQGLLELVASGKVNLAHYRDADWLRFPGDRQRVSRHCVSLPSTPFVARGPGSQTTAA